MSSTSPSAAVAVDIQLDSPKSAKETKISVEETKNSRDKVPALAAHVGASSSKNLQTSPPRLSFPKARRRTLEKFLNTFTNVRPSNIFAPGIPFPVARRGTLEKIVTRLSPSEALATLKRLAKGTDRLTRRERAEKLLKDGFAAYTAANLSSSRLSLPPQVIRFKNVTYIAKVLIAERQFPTLGSTILDLLSLCKRKPQKKFRILDNCSGYLMPGSITMICGPPGCGKTSLLKALSGRLIVEKGSNFSGTILYNNKDVKDPKVFVRRIASYIPQIDRHHANLTVFENIQFAYNCTSMHHMDYSYAGLEGVKQSIGLEITLRVLLLSHVADTIIGDDFVRGVSGGERHRVSMAEFSNDSAVVNFMDDATSGQDSSASQQMVSAVFTYNREMHGTVLISLNQPTEELFELCDRLIIMAEGQIIYQGPRDEVMLYFTRLGYVKPMHVDAADFLQELTTPQGRLYLQPGFKHLDTESFVKAYQSSDLYKDMMRVVNDQEVMHLLWCKAEKPLGLTLRDRERNSVPGTYEVEVCEVEPTGNVSMLHYKDRTCKVKEGDIITGVPSQNGMLKYLYGTNCPCFAADVRRKVSQVQGLVRLQLERKKNDEEVGKNFKVLDSEFVQNWWDSMRNVLARESKLLSREKSLILARLLQAVLMSVVVGTLFYQVPHGPIRRAMDLRRSLSFMACSHMFVSCMGQIPAIIADRKVFEKQYSARFFRPSIYVIATTIAQFPYFVVEVVVYCSLFYWLTGLSATNHGAQFFMFMLLALYCLLVGAALSRLSASICRTTDKAMSLVGTDIILILFVVGTITIISTIFSGYTATKNKTPHWWIWAYYLSPLQYGITGMVCNEFLSGSGNEIHKQPCTSDVTYCRGRMNMTIGQAYLDLFDMPTTYFAGVWTSVIALFLLYMALICLTFWSVARLRFDEVKLPSRARLLGNASQKRTLSQCEQESIHGDNTSLMECATSQKNLTAIVEFQPCLLSFHQLYYEVTVPGAKTPKVLLNGISGYAKPGTMTALMGSSGAGKTTLLDVLAGRKTTGKIKGDILLNGFPKQQDTFARVSGYVEQYSIHQPFITVKEALEFSAALRLPRSVLPSQRKEFVKEVTLMLELEDIQNNLVGSIGDSGLSLEEAKRLTIGVELVANPSIIFFDEPTTGLDNRSAQIVINLMKKIVQSGRTAICTIHQPTKRQFLTFDQLLMLKKGGEIAYFGKIGPDAKDLLGYFYALPGITKYCGPNQNPATYLVDLIIGDRVAQVENRDFGDDYLRSNLRTDNWQELEKIQHVGEDVIGPTRTLKGYAASWHTMITMVVKRQFTVYWRNVDYNFLRLAFSFTFAIFLGSSFWQIKYDSIPGLVSRTGLIYISISLSTAATGGTIIPQVAAERPVYYREMASNMYSSLVYAGAWALVEVFYLIAITLIFCAICFGMSGVATNDGNTFLRIWLLFSSYITSVMCFGLAVTMMTPNPQVASIIVPVVTNLWSTTCGFLIHKKDIPRFWTWLYWFNPTQFVLSGAMKSAFYCDMNNPECSTCSLNPSNGTCPTCDCVHLEDQNSNGLVAWLVIKTQYSLNDTDVGADIGILCAFAFVFFGSGLTALRFMRFSKR